MCQVDLYDKVAGSGTSCKGRSCKEFLVVVNHFQEKMLHVLSNTIGIKIV